MRTLKQHESIERDDFRRKLESLKKLPLAERKENRDNLVDALENQLKHFIDSAEWVLQGSYGFGAYVVAKEVIRSKSMNRHSWLFTTVSALEYSVTAEMANRAWNSLDRDLQKRISEYLGYCMDNQIARDEE